MLETIQTFKDPLSVQPPSDVLRADITALDLAMIKAKLQDAEEGVAGPKKCATQ